MIKTEQANRCSWMLTTGCYAVMLHLVVCLTFVYVDLEVFLAKRFLAMLTFKRQKVDEEASRMGTLFAYGE